MSTPAKATKQHSWLGLLVPALLVFAVLIALGTWQIERKAWKEGLIAALTERLAALAPQGDGKGYERTTDRHAVRLDPRWLVVCLPALWPR